MLASLSPCASMMASGVNFSPSMMKVNRSDGRRASLRSVSTAIRLAGPSRRQARAMAADHDLGQVARLRAQRRKRRVHDSHFLVRRNSVVLEHAKDVGLAEKGGYRGEILPPLRQAAVLHTDLVGSACVACGRGLPASCHPSSR